MYLISARVGQILSGPRGNYEVMSISKVHRPHITLKCGRTGSTVLYSGKDSAEQAIESLSVLSQPKGSMSSSEVELEMANEKKPIKQINFDREDAEGKYKDAFDILKRMLGG